MAPSPFAATDHKKQPMTSNLNAVYPFEPSRISAHLLRGPDVEFLLSRPHLRLRYVLGADPERLARSYDMNSRQA